MIFLSAEPRHHFLHLNHNSTQFDKTSSQMTSLDDYSTYIEETEQQLSTAVTIRGLGGEINFLKLIALIETFNQNEEMMCNEGAKIKSVINVQAFDYDFCLRINVIFWNFLKTSTSFEKAPWYYRDYIVAKLFRQSVKISEILQVKYHACNLYHRNETYNNHYI